MKSESTKKTYLSLESRLVLSVIVAIYIVLEGQNRPVWISIFDPNVFIAIIFSIGIALILTGIMHSGTKILDRHAPWEVGFNKRLAFQLLFCALFPIAIDLILVRCFFWLFHFDFEKSNYITSEFPLAKLLIYGFNFWYYFRYHERPKAGRYGLENHVGTLKSNEHDLEETASNQAPLLAFNGTMGVNNRVFHVRDMNCYKREANEGIALLKDNTLWFIDFKTDELEEQLNTNDFFKINRNVIISFDTIETYKNEGKSGTVILKSGIDFDGSVSISRSRYSKFKIAFKSYIESQ